MKFLVLQRFRLVDRNQYLDQDMLFGPEDEYANTSRSVAAAIKAGWMRRISDEEAEKLEKLQMKPVVKEAVVRPTSEGVEKPSKLPAMIHDMKPEDLADETISSDAIIKARDKRRQEALGKVIVKPVAPGSAADEKQSEPVVKADKRVDDKKDDASAMKEEIRQKMRTKRLKSLKIHA
jgi:hypothetical protein